MKTSRRIAPTAFLILICCSPAWPVSEIGAVPNAYYLSSTSGNDRNDGRSPDRAWQHLWKIYEKSTSKDPFQPGDSILLKRGDQWDGQIRLQAQGTAQEPITLGAYGQGAKPLIYGDDQQARWEPVSSHLGIYTTDMGPNSILGSIFLDGKILKAIYPAASLNRNEDMGIFLGKLQPGLAGQYGGRLWVRMMDGGTPDKRVRIFRVAGVSLANSSYVRIEDLDLQRFYTGIDITNSRQVLVQHNDIQDVLGIGIYLRSGDADCRVESNTIFRGGNTALYVLKGTGNTFRDNWVSHVDKNILGLRVSGDGMGIGLQESQQGLVEYNYFAHSGGMDFYFEQGSTVRYNYLYQVWSAGAPHGTNLNVYGNIYNLGGQNGKPGSTGVNAVVTGPGTIVVFNNTIFNASGFSLMGSSDKGGTVIFSDNLASSSVPGSVMTAFGPSVESNHNCFSSPGQPVFRYRKANFSSLNTYQAASGLDRDSIYADPQFPSTASITPLDFRIKPGSGCDSPASRLRLADAVNGRTYDHDHTAASEPVIGALRADKSASAAAALTRTCRSHCFQHPFPVPSGVYLVGLKFAASTRSGQAHEFEFVLNGRNVAAQFESSQTAGSDDNLLRYFLVRPDGGSIRLEASPGSDISVVNQVDITPFDTSHGDGTQVIPW